MKRSPREQLIYVVSILAMAVPFAFAVIRLISTRHDVRYLWMAIAAFLAATGVMAIGTARALQPGGVVARSAMSFVISTLITASAGYLVGARSAVGVWLVAASFAFCCVTGNALIEFSRSRPDHRPIT